MSLAVTFIGAPAMAANLGSGGAGAAGQALFNWWLQGGGHSPSFRQSVKPAVELGLSTGNPAFANLAIQKRFDSGFGVRCSGLSYGSDNWGIQLDLIRRLIETDDFRDSVDVVLYGSKARHDLQGSGFFGADAVNDLNDYGAGLGIQLGGFFASLGLSYEDDYRIKIQPPLESGHAYGWQPMIEFGYLWALP